MYRNRRFGRRVPEINSSSTADIAFLLLIFFLMTTSMDTDMGLPRRLPEWAADGRKPETVEVSDEIDYALSDMQYNPHDDAPVVDTIDTKGKEEQR